MKIHLVDGTYELFRSFYGAPSRTNDRGEEIGATRGLILSLLALLREDGVSHVAIAFDSVVESFRNELFDGYKTGEGIDENLLRQFPLAERAARALGLTVWSMVEFEADDALATAASRWAEAPEVEQVVLCSPDKDLAQCVVGKKVVCFDRRKQVLLDEAGVVEKFGVLPGSMADYLGLVGDSADGIPGLKGWGAKSASTVLARFLRIEDIPDEAERWEVKVRGAAKLAATLAAQREDALLYRRLAVLRTDVPLTETLEDLAWRGAHGEAFQELCRELGDSRLAQRPHRWQG